MPSTRSTNPPLVPASQLENINRANKRKRGVRDDGEDARAATQRRARPAIPSREQLQAELAESRTSITRLQAEIAQLRRELRERDRRLDELEAGPARAPTRQSPLAPERVTAPAEKRTYYAEPAAVRNEPNKNDREAMKTFYRAGGVQIDGKSYFKIGKDLSGPEIDPYGTVRPREREATPEPQSRRHNVDLASLSDRLYFDVHYHDWSIAEHQYGLVKEARVGSRWEQNPAGDVNKAANRFYTEDPERKAAALERWSIYNIETGRTTAPPMRGLQHRTRDGNGRE